MNTLQLYMQAFHWKLYFINQGILDLKSLKQFFFLKTYQNNYQYDDNFYESIYLIYITKLTQTGSFF